MLSHNLYGALPEALRLVICVALLLYQFIAIGQKCEIAEMAAKAGGRF